MRDPFRGTGRTTRMLAKAALSHGNVAIVGPTVVFAENLAAIAKQFAQEFGNTDVCICPLQKDQEIRVGHYDAIFIDHSVGDLE